MKTADPINEIETIDPAGVVLIGVLFWRDKISPLQVIGILLIIIGTFALNALTPTRP